MSSSADPTGGATTSQFYFCHQCKGTVTIVPPIAADPVCPICGGTFVEELELTERNRTPTPGSFFSSQASGFNPSLVPTSVLPFNPYPGSVEIRSTGDFAGLLGLDFTPFNSQPPNNPGFDPQLFVRDHIQSIFSGGRSIQVNFDGAGGGGGAFAGNIGDYVFGSGLEHVMHQLFENDPSRYGPPPAAKSAVEALPVIQISEEMVAGDDDAQCAVCKDAFDVGAEAMQLPCKHIYHKYCIVPWLELHNSCPVCRHELPTDDPDYAQRVMTSPAATGGLPGGGEQRPSGRRTIQRRVRISLPLPLRGFGAQPHLSGNAGGGDSGSNSSDWDENFEGRQINGPDPRHEDLD